MLFLKLATVLLLGQISATEKLPDTTQRYPDYIEIYRKDAIEKWEKDIIKLETLDREEQDPKRAVLFLGSSSIRRWETMAEDLHPWPTIRRGYGGAKFSDLAIFTQRLVKPHKPSAIAIFVANDISGKEQDKTPEQVIELVKFVASEIRELAPTTPLFFFEITPTSSRFSVWDKIQQVNLLVKNHCEQTENTYFIATAEHFLVEGAPNDALFVDDKLHLNDEGYKLWAKIVKERFRTTLGDPN